MTTPMRLRLGTRASPLARWQAEWVAAELGRCEVAVELVPISTQGDRRQAGPIAAIGGEGVFTKELQRALVEGAVDLAVHSLKDLPTEPVEGLMLAAVPQRGPVGDVLVAPRYKSLAALPQGAVVGTGSQRRRAQLWHVRPDLELVDVRGNVDTRLRKLREGAWHALVLAEAGLRRLGLAEHISEPLSPHVLLPAVGQGALGIEVRAADTTAIAAVAALDHGPTHQAVLAERSLLATLRGGCLAPVGAWARLDEQGRLCLSAVVLSADGRQRVTAEAAGEMAAAVELGRTAAEDLLGQGAAELIQGAREAGK